jgi:6-methylsalicylate decarboxylase
MASGLIDFHHHILPPIFIETLGERLGPQSLSGAAPEWSPSISLEMMGRNSISKAITSFGPPGFWFGDIEETKALTRSCNEYSAELRRDYPGRFEMFAVLPQPNVDACLAEIEYAFDTLGAAGVELMTNCDGAYPGDPAFSPIFEELNRRKAVVFVHPIPAKYGRPCLSEVPPPTLEFPFDTTRAILSLLVHGTLARCHDVRFVFSHGGGCAPFLAERIARLTDRDAYKASVPGGAISELRRLYFDTALSTNKAVFSSLLNLVGTDQILFGSDFPQAPEATTSASISALPKLELSEQALDDIRRGNAIRLINTSP